MRKAKGIAIFTVYRIGFLMSARAGTGVVLAKLPNGEWSAPTAIGIGGLGGGFNAGAEMVDFLIVLNSRAAVRTFMSSGSLQLGGNLALAVGPLGRSGEASAALNAEMKMSAMFSYSMSRGLYGGVTIEGTVLLDRPDANRKTYGEQLSAQEILTGHVEPPQFAMPLVGRLEEITGGSAVGVNDDASMLSDSTSELDVPPGSVAAYAPRRQPTTRRAAPRPPRAREPMDDLDAQLQSASLTDSRADDDVSSYTSRSSYVARAAPTRRDIPERSAAAYAPGADFDARTGAATGGAYRPYRSRRVRPPVDDPLDEPGAADDDPFADPQPAHGSGSGAPSGASLPYKPRAPRARARLLDLDDEELGAEAPAPTRSDAPAPASSATPAFIPPELLEGDLVVALHDFDAQEPTDLSFKRGDIIRVTRRTNNETDWWTGELAAAFGDEKPASGMFPSNYTEPL
ncbi:hypothetical protein MBRA1_000052 [Malassezia brasiliensis]|uniref:SH3 domain-containing protein n=1 Tax=Malassezia brasiliensis TaxID=1821822 RepID=A0AAF0DQA8_9BASI|nr:hypothetical protein MBRA1_000052 [Malassezia brasiliensis]